jgi:glyoxylase-like metal-dependent hydrolase (beta-lactamase superfamily II)
MLTLNIGELKVHHIEEMCFPEASPFESFVGFPEDAIERNLDWLAPNFYDASQGKTIMSSHSWILQTTHHNILIDTCCGNDKTRPGLPFLNNLSFPYLDRLAEYGLQPEDIDFVMCTHLHLDHVGWNTRLIDGRWVPTFPNARYIFGRREYDYWVDLEKRGETEEYQLGVLDSDILPVEEAGLMTLVDDGYQVDDAVKVQAAEGHTEGHFLVRATSNGNTGMFLGDVVHMPLQIVYPEAYHMHSSSPERAVATAKSVLAECAEHGHLLLPAHFPPPSVGRVAPNGDRFRFIPGQ